MEKIIMKPPLLKKWAALMHSIKCLSDCPVFQQPWIMIYDYDHLSFFFSGMHCSEKGHKENVCHEVYEQTSVRGAQ